MKFDRIFAASLVSALALLAAPSFAADGPLGLELDGSFSEGGFDRTRYVPPVTHPTLNETPFITTELRPIYAHHNIPNDFVTSGGEINVIALQGRVAITERLGFIATTDGWGDFDFDAVLPDTDGFLDIAAGFKYALIHDPAGGNILTAGLRYTAPIGDVKTAGIDLTGRGDGFLNPFLTGATMMGDLQLQGSAGVQIALSNENWSYVHLGGHADYEVYDNVFPFVEANAILPVDGGNQFPKGSPLGRLTGADIADIGAANPRDIVTLGGGLRFRLTDNVLLGAAYEHNIASNDEDTVFDWRITTDLVVHF